MISMNLDFFYSFRDHSVHTDTFRHLQLTNLFTQNNYAHF